MAVTVEITFPWGRYHATPWGQNVNEGRVDWPPSPWRFLRALYATWKTRVPELDEHEVLGALGALVSPPDFLLPPVTYAHTRHYMPDNRYGTDNAFDAFVVLERGGGFYVSWEVEPGQGERSTLDTLLQHLPYLGRAESVCAARLLAPDEEGRVAGGARCRPLERMDEALGAMQVPVQVLVPEAPLDVDALTATTTEVRKAKRLDPPGSRWVAYTPVEEHEPRRTFQPPVRGRVQAVRFALDAPARPARHAAVLMADALRKAAIDRLNGHRSRILSGKDEDGNRVDDDHGHAHFLAFASDPSEPLIDTLAVWAPAGMDQADLAALAGLSHLGGKGFERLPDFRPSRLAMEAAGPVDLVLPELVGMSRVWESATPYAPPRNKRANQEWKEHAEKYLRRDLTAAGFPTLEKVEVLRGDWLDYRRYRFKEKLADSRRAFGLRVTFPEPVEGPILLGALRHFGLGLFRPQP